MAKELDDILVKMNLLNNLFEISLEANIVDYGWIFSIITWKVQQYKLCADENFEALQNYT